MERQAKWIITVVLAVCAAICIGGICLINELFPKAKPVALPEREGVLSVSLGCNSSVMGIPMGEQYWDETMEAMGKARPTRQPSLNDHPDARDYFGIAIQTTEGLHRYFLYEKDGQAYLEVPYEGVYQTDAELLDLVSQYFQEG